MENSADYSQFVFAAYGLTTLILTSLALLTLKKYFAAKTKNVQK